MLKKIQLTTLLTFAIFFATAHLSAQEQDSSAIDYIKMELQSFKNSVNIKWEVSTESGGDHFVIEKYISENNWQRKTAEDSKKDHIFYQTYEKSITNYAQKHVELFRIIRVDAKGVSTVLDTAKVYHPVLSNIKLEQVPGKLNKEVWVTYKCLKEESVNISIINLEGDIFYDKYYDAELGDNTVLIKIKKLKPGQYQIVVRDEMDNKLTKLLRVYKQQ